MLWLMSKSAGARRGIEKEEVMRTLRMAIVIIAIMSLGAGCIDVTEHITRDARGMTCVFVKVGISKAMMEFAAGMADESQDPFGEMMDLDANDFLDGIPEGVDVSFEKVDNEMETGFAVRMTYDGKKFSGAPPIDATDETALLPIEDDKTVRIVFSATDGAGTGDQEQNPMAEGIMAAFKYRLTIGKAFMKTISRVVVATKDFDYKPVAIEMPDMFLIEIPMVYLLNSREDVQIVLYR
jgi:hypothetical protein